MMVKLPLVSGKQAVRIFRKFGWDLVRQKGSHVIMTKEGMDVTLSIPQHKTIKRGLLTRLLKDSKITKNQFIDCHKG